MLEQSKQIVENTDFLKQRKTDRKIAKYNKAKHRLFIFSIFLSLLIIAGIYLLLDISNIFQISVEGNIYLKDDDIVALSRLSTNDKFLLTIPSNIESRILQNELIDQCKVELLDNRLVKITVKEKKIIGYSYDDGNVLILADDSRVKLEVDSLYVIEKVPLIMGFSRDDLILIEKNLKDIDYKLINEISDIISYPSLKYQNLEVIMRDGNYIFTSPYGLKILNRYYDIDNSYKDKENKCFYFEDISGNAYASACPWQAEAIENNVDNKKED